jgi:putative tryptophan/tyrosine transport system substrate-binding protein
MRRREFIAGLSGTAAWPLVARAQSERLRRIGVLMGADDTEIRASYAAFVEALQRLGWTDSRNVQIETRWATGHASDYRRHATDLVALAPEIIVANSIPSLASLLQATHTVPIVFAAVADPVGAGLIQSMAHPGGNATGFVQFEYTLSGKWLELLKEIAPSVKRTAVLRDPELTAGIGQFAVIQSVAPALRMEVTAINMRDAGGEIERAVTAFAGSPNSGLILTSSALAVAHRELIISLAAKHKLPAVYYRRGFVASGGLISYGYDILQLFQGAAGYVDRILRGEKPADLPAQAPNKYELVINLKTAKALGLEMPPSVLARADEVIE